MCTYTCIHIYIYIYMHIHIYIYYPDLNFLEFSIQFFLFSFPMFLLFSHYVVTDSCNPMGCNPPDSSVHVIFQARTLQWVAIFFSRGSPWPRDRTRISCIGRETLYPWTIREAHFTSNHHLNLQLLNSIYTSPSPSFTDHDICHDWKLQYVITENYLRKSVILLFSSSVLSTF